MRRLAAIGGGIAFVGFIIWNWYGDFLVWCVDLID